MSRRLTSILLLAWCGVFVASSATPQSESSVRWLVTVGKSVEGDSPGERIVFGAQQQLLLNLGLSNAEGPSIVGALSLPDHLHVALMTEDQLIPIQLEAGALNSPSSLLLPGQGLNLPFVLKREDGLPLSIGRYVITTDVTQFLTALRFEDGSPWTGRAKGVDVRTVVVKDVATPEDRISLYDLEGNYHLGKGNYAEAIRNLERLVELTPTRWHSHAALGAAYLRTGRYVEAAEAVNDIETPRAK